MDYESNSDLYAKLPTKSQAKLRRLFDDRDRAYGAVRSAFDRVQEAREDRDHLRNLADIQIEKLGGVAVSYASGRREVEIVTAFGSREALEGDIERNNQPVAEAEDRLEHANVAYQAASEKFNEHAYLQEVSIWVDTYFRGGGRLAHQPLPAVKLLKGETHRQGVERIRQQISSCDDEWTRLESIPLPADELKSRITAEVDAIAALGQPKVQKQDRFGDGVSGLAPALRLRRTGEMIVSDAPSAFICWLHRDTIIARLHAEADALDQADAMSDDARDSAFSQLLDQKLGLEFSEESFIVAAAAEGTQIIRRRDCDPRAVLEIQEIFS
jgi:hypothetical protein